MTHRSDGFTLVEIMVATTISVMIIGTVYAAFRTSLNVYQRDQVRMVMLQRNRAALDRISRDLNNLFYKEDDEELTIIVQDYSDTETNMDMDMLSFVTIVEPNLNDYVQSEENTKLTVESTDEGEENALPSDLARIIYFIGKNPDEENVLSLMRIQTTELSTEEIDDMLSEFQSSNLSEEMRNELNSSILIDYIAGLNIRYYDGTDWVDTWDMEEEGSLPRAVEVTLSTTDADNKGKELTQATVVYLPFSKSSGSEQTAEAGQSNQNVTQPMQYNFFAHF